MRGMYGGNDLIPPLQGCEPNVDEPMSMGYTHRWILSPFRAHILISYRSP